MKILSKLSYLTVTILVCLRSLMGSFIDLTRTTKLFGLQSALLQCRSCPRFDSTVVLEMCCAKKKTTMSLQLQISNVKISQSSSLCWLNCCFRDVLCQRQDDNEFLYLWISNGKISQSSSLWFDCCFRDVLCQSEDDNELRVFNGKILQSRSQI